MCTNNQVEYEALLHGLRLLSDMGVKDVEAFGDSMLVIQQIKGESQCLDGSLNEYRDDCLSAIGVLDSFSISHIPRKDNVVRLNPPTGVDRQHESREAQSLNPSALQLARAQRLEFVGRAT
jgi:ribonuclease HI